MKNRIRTLRNYLGLNQEEFGEKLGVSRSVIVNAELGRATPNELFVRHMSDIYGVNLKWLETGEGEMLLESKSTLVDELATRHNLSPMERGIISKFVEMDAGRRAVFLEVARSLLDAGDIAAAESSADLVEKRSCPPGSETMSG